MIQGKVLIVGDVMLDRYVSGTVTRISPEAPIPVLVQNEVTCYPGGAANLAVNLSNLEIEVDLMAVTGSDEEAALLINLCELSKITCLFQKTNTYTILKTRIISKNQQMLRIDREDQFEKYSVLTKLPENIDLKKYQLIVVSDYGKGFCNDQLIIDLIGSAVSLNIPVLVDPKGNSWEKYKGATLIKPNLSELFDFVGKQTEIKDEFISELVEKVKILNIKSVVISRSNEGLIYLEDKIRKYYAAPHVDVFDVSGAGDTVMAVIAYGFMNNLSMDQMLFLAVKCGSFVVTKSKTYAIKKTDLESIRN